MKKRRCSQKRADGSPCRAWAIRELDPPLCSAHAGRNRGVGAPVGNQNRVAHGFYGRSYTIGEIADLVAFAADMTLDDEIAVARVALRRVMTELKERLPVLEFAHLIRLVFQGVTTIARVLRAKRALDGDAIDGLSGAIAQALTELATEWGVEL